MEDRTLLSAFLVTTTGDSGPGSLRQAILDSNAATGGTNTINFQIPGPGVQVIAPTSPLPAITRAVLIDGLSQPGYAGTPLIELDGSQAGTADGLTITGPDVTVRGFDIGGFGQGAGIHITGAGATGDWVYGDFLGTDPTGTQAAPNNVGVEIDGGAANNLIGTNGDGVHDAAERNVISGNQFAGIWINGRGTDGNAIAGNFIGTSVTGDVALNNDTSPGYAAYYGGNAIIGGGVLIEGGASENRIGTNGQGVDDAGQRNVIAGSNNDGIDIIGAGTADNLVADNFIGTDLSGKIPLGIAGDGVFLADGASSNWVGVNPVGGAAVDDEWNVISGSTGYDGVQILESDNNVVAGDKIGTDATGAVPLGNSRDGVEIDSSSGNMIGGTVAGAADIILGNGGTGVVLDTSSHNRVEGDFITDNGGPGVAVTRYPSIGNQITANRIFGNTGQAIDLGNDGVTDNAAAPRSGPNNLQNFPVIVSTAEGQTEGWLGGSEPDSTYRIDVFASAGYGPGGAGEAQDYLGSLQEATNATGQVIFAVPFTAPAGLPIITATATDPQGNTSEVSALRQATVEAPKQPFRVGPGQPINFSSTSGQEITLGDPDAGPFDLVWDLTLSVGAGSLALASTSGLVGSGNATASLAYDGTLSALDRALDGLRYVPQPGYQGDTTLSVNAQSEGASPVQAQVSIVVTDGVFQVTTTADSGPGSLRQAILDSNAATGGTNTIDFDIPGQGVQMIAPVSPLPAVMTSVLIDGRTQPGFAGSPLVALDSPSASNPDGLSVDGASVTVRGLAIAGFGLDAGSQTDVVTVPSIPF
jgi:hypothetical protein